MEKNYETKFENIRSDPVKIYTEKGDVLAVVPAGRNIFIVSQDSKGVFSRCKKITFLLYRENAWVMFTKRPGWVEPGRESEWVSWFFNSLGNDLESIYFSDKNYHFPLAIPVPVPILDLSNPWAHAESVELQGKVQRMRDEKLGNKDAKMPAD